MANAPPTKTSKTSSAPPFIIRPGRLREWRILGRIAADTYFPSALTAWLSPHRAEFYSDYAYEFEQRALTIMLDPRVRTLVACEPSRPDLPIGYIHYKRLGDDGFAKQVVREKENLFLWIARWLAWAWFLHMAAFYFFFSTRNRALDPEAARLFREATRRDEETYWEPFPERWNRWHLQSFVIRKEFQGQGLGRRMIQNVLKLGEEENVYVGLEASPEGESLYRSVGFEFLGIGVIPGHEELSEGGGVFLWTPPDLKAKNQKTAA